MTWVLKILGFFTKDRIKTFLWWIIPIICFIVIGVTVYNHFRYVKSLEDDKVDLIKEKTQIKAELDKSTEANRENERLANEYRNLQKANKAIGDAENLLATAREDFYEKLRKDINSSAPSDKCDFALVQRTLDQLWSREAPAGD